MLSEMLTSPFNPFFRSYQTEANEAAWCAQRVTLFDEFLVAQLGPSETELQLQLNRAHSSVDPGVVRWLPECIS